jgi:glycosyltransferase involved in cell wall biosynthesis
MAERQLSVAFLTSARAWRGSGVSFFHIAQGLVTKGHRVHMLAGDDPVLQAFADRGLSAGRVPTGNTGIRGARALARSLRSVKADCLVVDRPRDLRLGALSSLFYPVALVNRYNLSRSRPPLDLLSRLAFRRVRLTIFVSETSARQALTGAHYLQSRPHQVIPEAVGPQFYPDPAAADEFRRAYGLGDREFVVAVGSLTADKRYDFLLNILSRLGVGAPLLVVCGAGSKIEELRELAARLQVEARFLGFVPPGKLPGAYSGAVALVHVCEIETFGLSVLEGMACGCAVVAADGGAVPEVLGGTGILSPPGDAEAFAARLRELLVQPDQRAALGATARRRAARFSLAAMQQAHVRAIEWACSPDQAEGS